MREEDLKIVEEFKSRLPEEVLSRVERLIAFGSRATGEAPEDSDLDLVALVDEKTREIEELLDDVAYSVMWDHDFKPIISLKVFSERDFDSAVQRGLSFYKNVDRHGVSL
jgi:predicted nucleotidyltransferase